jgi:hypothetical protein
MFHVSLSLGLFGPPDVLERILACTGFVCLELYKVVQQKPLEKYRNTFVNLALPLFAMSEPVSSKVSASAHLHCQRVRQPSSTFMAWKHRGWCFRSQGYAISYDFHAGLHNWGSSARHFT